MVTGAAGLGEFSGDAFSGAVVADGGGGDDAVTSLEELQAGVAHLLGGDDRVEFASDRGGEVDRPADKNDVPTGGEGGFGDGVSHAAAAGVGEVSDVVEVFAGGAGGDQQSHVGGILGKLRGKSGGRGGDVEPSLVGQAVRRLQLRDRLVPLVKFCARFRGRSARRSAHPAGSGRPTDLPRSHFAE